MGKQKVIRVRVHEPSVKSLAKTLFSDVVEPGNDRFGELPATLAESSARDYDGAVGDHIGDDLLIRYVLQDLEGPAEEQAARHIESCDACAGEVHRMQRLSALWSDESAVQTLERRFRVAARPGILRISLSRLLLPQVAFGEGKCDEPVSVKFPITENGIPVEGLTGNLTRSNREYYVCVKETAARNEARFVDREIFISLSNPRQEHRILERKIDVGVAVLLGTGLRLTDESELEARLLPAGDPRPDGEKSA